MHETTRLSPTDFHAPLDHHAMMEEIDALSVQYSFLRVYSLGTSLLGREIPMLRLGNEHAGRTVLYVAAHHSMEWICSAVLLRFVRALCEAYENSARICRIQARYLLSTRLLCVVPMLNPDGVELQQHGACDSPLRDAELRMNRCQRDFTHWQANARGVDLNHNYAAGFAEYKILEREAGIFGGGPSRFSGEYPESEPETAALASYLRIDRSVRLLLTLHTQGEEIYCASGGICPPRGQQIAAQLSRLSGYPIAVPEGMACYGGLTDWAIRSLSLPACTIECGRGRNPLPLSDGEAIYARIREMLFTAPILI